MAVAVREASSTAVGVRHSWQSVSQVEPVREPAASLPSGCLPGHLATNSVNRPGFVAVVVVSEILTWKILKYQNF